MPYFEFGFLGHVLRVSFGPEDDDVVFRPEGIGGGSGGVFERFEPEPEIYYEEDPEDRKGRKFGFCG
jgi:hypothetical protein